MLLHLSVIHSVHKGRGQAWPGRGSMGDWGMHGWGCPWLGGHAWLGTCMAEEGAMCGWGACKAREGQRVARSACMAGEEHGLPRGVHGWLGGVHGWGHAWLGGMCGWGWDMCG